MGFSAIQEMEQRLLKETMSLLGGYGQAVPQFLTSSMYSSPLRSLQDLVFVPHSGNQEGVEFVVELKCSSSARLDNAWLDFALSARERIYAANRRFNLRFILATTAILSERQRAWAQAHSLEVLDQIKDGQDLACRLLDIAGLKVN